MKTKIYVPDMECDSCIKVLDKRFAKLSGVEETKFSQDSVDISYDEKSISLTQIIETIKVAGYRAGLHPFDKKTFTERIREFKEKRAKYELEHKIIPYTGAIFLILSIIQIIAYFFYFKSIPNFISQYAWWFFYLNI
ncbi:heavy metal translocating P-type ATPase, partial [Candidatus Woesearchaeota archaeon]|nr:heavy metal translocating P-type ATPase [Candidatus Woesearchaeota archaeon]